jgi:hypothetical protein
MCDNNNNRNASHQNNFQTYPRHVSMLHSKRFHVCFDAFRRCLLVLTEQFVKDVPGSNVKHKSA